MIPFLILAVFTTLGWVAYIRFHNRQEALLEAWLAYRKAQDALGRYMDSHPPHLFHTDDPTYQRLLRLQLGAYLHYGALAPEHYDPDWARMLSARIQDDVEIV